MRSSPWDDFRFRNAELIDAVADGLEALFDRHFPDLAGPLVVDLEGDDFTPLADFRSGHLDIGVVVLEDLFKRGAGGAVGQFVGDEAGLRGIRLAEAHPFRHQGLLEIAGRPQERTVHRLGGVHLEDEVHAALKIEPQMDLVLGKVVVPEHRKIAYQRRCQKEQRHQAGRNREGGAPFDAAHHNPLPLSLLVALGQDRADEPPGDLDPDLVGNFERHDRLRQGGDLAVDPPRRHDHVTMLEVCKHLLEFLLFFLLWANDEKIKDGEQDRHDDDETVISPSSHLASSGASHCVGSSDHFSNPPFSLTL